MHRRPASARCSGSACHGSQFTDGERMTTATAGERIWVADMEPSARYPLYTRGNVGEVFPHVLSALGGTLMGEDVGRAQMEVFREIGFVTPRDLDGIGLGTGVFGGYLYGSGSLARIMGVRTPGMNATTS